MLEFIIEVVGHRGSSQFKFLGRAKARSWSACRTRYRRVAVASRRRLGRFAIDEPEFDRACVQVVDRVRRSSRPVTSLVARLPYAAWVDKILLAGLNFEPGVGPATHQFVLLLHERDRDVRVPEKADAGILKDEAAGGGA